MKLRSASLIAAGVALGAGAWLALRPPELADAPSAEASVATPAPETRAAPSSTKLTAAAVLSIDPRASLKPAAKPNAHPSLHAEFFTAKRLKALYDRLKNSPEGQTAEGMYVMYELLKQCATVTDRRGPQPPSAAKRDEFVQAIPGNDPQRDKRIAAFDDSGSNRCAGFEGITTTQADLAKLLSDAAGRGDSAAQAAMIEQDLWNQRRAAGPENRWGRDTVAPTDQQVANLRQLLASRDPDAMVIAGRVLASSWADFSMRIGPDQQVVEPRALQNAWQLVACDYGYPCGADNQRLLNACAYQGHCDASSLADFMFYYGGTPHDSQLLSQYQAILAHALQTGDWSQLTVVRGPVPPGANRFFFARPGG